MQGAGSQVPDPPLWVIDTTPLEIAEGTNATSVAPFITKSGPAPPPPKSSRRLGCDSGLGRGYVVPASASR